MNKYGLIGRSISYSFSPGYFSKKFDELGLEDHVYSIFDLDSITDFLELIQENPDIQGLNVTIPYKEEIIPYLDDLDPVAAEIGAVNTICFRNGKSLGYNTDVIGFKNSLVELLLPTDTKALILGTGGASKAIKFVLKSLEIESTTVSRTAQLDALTYEDLNLGLIRDHTLIINCTPLGTYPDLEARPPIPYDALTDDHYLFDLIYNPEKSAFLQAGETAGARLSNGYAMLVGQAEASWELWQAP